MYMQLVLALAVMAAAPLSANKLPGYLSVFGENPSVEDIMAEVNMDTPQVIKNREIMAERFPFGSIKEIIPGRAYQAVAYALGYPLCVITNDDTLILVDTPEGYNASLTIINAFRAIPEIGNKPWVAVVITLFHGDHLWGVRPFVEDPYNQGVPPKIIMNQKSLEEAKIFDMFNAFKYPRLARQFGIDLAKAAPEQYLHAGASPRLMIDIRPLGPLDLDLLVFSNEDEVLTRTIGGLRLDFYSVPGYTPDQILTNFPLLRLLHIADVYYFSLPNIYTIRGERTRDARKWSLDVYKAASIPDVDYAVATHALPLVGGEIKEVLTNYAQGIKYIHDQTLRFMMKGLTADVICTNMELPPSLAKLEYLVEIYGIVETACISVVDFYVGWFSGQTEDLFTLNRVERRERMLNLVKPERMVVEAIKAYNEQDYRWSMELSSMVWRNDPTNLKAKEIRGLSQIRLAEQQFSIGTRNYYLSMVLEDYDLITLVINVRNSYGYLPLDSVCANLAAHVNSDKFAEEINEGSKTLFLELNTGKWKLKLQNSVLECNPFTAAYPEGAQVWQLTEGQYRSFLVKEIFAGTGVSQEDVVNFFSYIDFVDEV